MSEDRAAETSYADPIEANLPALRELCRRHGVRRLDLFGSAATGRFDPARSDLDFLVEFERPLTGGLSSPYFQLLEALEELFERKVDLVLQENLINPYRRRRILGEKLRLYIASDDI
jgi:predicted nucleotidyltransferase